jgi:glutathione S-transferase
MAAARILLWHIAISHYSEKARWALEHKSLEYERRAPQPGLHIAVAAARTRGRTFTLPVMELDGERIGGSAQIIAALEARFPEPALYPPDPVQRSRALELAGWFDRELGPYSRRLAFFELGRDPQLMLRLAEQTSPALAARLGRALVPYSRAMTALRYGAGSRRAAERARAKVLSAFERLESELGEGDYLAGGRFTVADLTAACMFVPIVLPEQAAVEAGQLPEPYERLRDSLRDRRGYRWVQEIFARHRERALAAA